MNKLTAVPTLVLALLLPAGLAACAPAAQTAPASTVSSHAPVKAPEVKPAEAAPAPKAVKVELAETAPAALQTLETSVTTVAPAPAAPVAPAPAPQPVPVVVEPVAPAAVPAPAPAPAPVEAFVPQQFAEPTPPCGPGEAFNYGTPFGCIYVGDANLGQGGGGNYAAPCNVDPALDVNGNNRPEYPLCSDVAAANGY